MASCHTLKTASIVFNSVTVLKGEKYILTKKTSQQTKQQKKLVLILFPSRKQKIATQTKKLVNFCLKSDFCLVSSTQTPLCYVI